jgi:hypothetical protein
MRAFENEKHILLGVRLRATRLAARHSSRDSAPFEHAG